jgi:insertion element IS1 protein InsB
MASVTVSCLYCHQAHVDKMGFSANGKQRYVCRNSNCRRTFILDYKHRGCIPGMDKTIVDMAMNGSGIRDTSRVLGISQTTVIETLKKKRRYSMKSTMPC